MHTTSRCNIATNFKLPVPEAHSMLDLSTRCIQAGKARTTFLGRGALHVYVKMAFGRH